MECHQKMGQFYSFLGKRDLDYMIIFFYLNFFSAFQVAFTHYYRWATLPSEVTFIKALQTVLDYMQVFYIYGFVKCVNWTIWI